MTEYNNNRSDIKAALTSPTQYSGEILLTDIGAHVVRTCDKLHNTSKAHNVTLLGTGCDANGSEGCDGINADGSETRGKEKELRDPGDGKLN
jgi:hypothetical protein